MERKRLNPLTPRVVTNERELKQIQSYLNDLEGVINTPDINNIALMGGYGSGKSTILTTFEHQQKKKSQNIKFLNISLALFEEKEGEINEPIEKLQTNILQQMFYQFPANQLPGSRFKRINNISKKKIALYSFAIVIWLLSFTLFLNFNYFKFVNPLDWSWNKNINWTVLFTSVIILGGFVWFLIANFYSFLNIRITKLSASQVELGDRKTISIFDKHLDEILYFFEETEIDIVFIQDLDRFKNTSIFNKMRELNLLINKNGANGKEVKFIYAIRDDVFKTKDERIKFFDYIIPVIPYVNYLNADDKLTELIQQEGIEEVLTNRFIRNITTVIDDIDMRILINIFNEFMVYRQLLENNKNLKADKLFSIITYKNLFPNDFSKLQIRQGELFEFFAQKENYIANRIEKLNERITKLTSKIESVDNEKITSLNDLRKMYLFDVIKDRGSFANPRLNNNRITAEELLEDDNFRAVIEGEYRDDYGRIDFSQYEKNYNERETLINQKLENTIEQYKEEISTINREIEELKEKSIKELFDNKSIDSDNLKGNLDCNIIRYFLFNGYIDESYEYYISLFHEINLSKNDFEFIQNVKARRKILSNLPLNNISNIIDRLDDDDYCKPHVLNEHLLHYLLENYTYDQRTDNFISVLSGSEKAYFTFIDDFIKAYPTDNNVFIKKLVSLKLNLWSYLINESHLPQEEISKYLSLIFNNANYESIIRLDNSLSINDYLSKMDCFFEFCSTINDKTSIIKYIEERDVFIEKLDLSNKNKLFDAVYENRRYDINKHNIKTIIQIVNDAINEDKFETSNYTYLKELNLEDLNFYIEDLLDFYVEILTQEFEQNTKENIESILAILNSHALILYKRNFIKIQTNDVDEISSIKDVEVQQLLFEENKIKISWENILNYFENAKLEDLDDTLINYFNDNTISTKLSKSKIKLPILLQRQTEDRKKTIQTISKNIIYSKKIHIDSYKRILNSIPYKYKSFNVEKIDIEKIKLLIDRSILSLTSDNFNALKNKEENLQILLLEKHKSDFLTRYNEFNIEVIDWKLILKSDKFTDKVKIDLIPKIEASLITADLELQELILLLTEKGIIKLDFNTLETIFCLEGNDLLKIKLLNDNIQNLSEQEIEDLTNLISEKYYQIFEKRKRPKFQYSTIIEQFIKSLYERKMISKFEVVKDKIKVVAKY